MQKLFDWLYIIWRVRLQETCPEGTKEQCGNFENLMLKCYFSGGVSMGSMGSAEPINFEKWVPEPINF